MAKLIFDIETVGEDFESLDPATQDALTHWIEDGDEKKLQEVKAKTGLSPLTGEIVAIGVYDLEKESGVVYFQSPGKKKLFRENKIEFKPRTEREMLQQFWSGALSYDELISFNGRTFDAPFLAIRSAVHKIKPSLDLLRNRYVGSQGNIKHIDLLDQLSFYGAMYPRGSLHLWTRVFGIESPKKDGISGRDVGRLFKEKEYTKIARYNANDLLATAELYRRWFDYIRI